ncbi:LytTR family two component transcriptional regulator [Arcicella aurantiaca]|uniref:LytTR family two component transcriptional regulator n=1 Tax=Arcicella aurantiaca TaxID=591202 RepID=A0A316DIQ4_9BACT|nr:LytTR family DNA-binding domain-containing protein [Arcicella aurantiaca]PWK18061.1 LytTR family two component transcriptional regulator [Arcicella aurantiaca]
MQVTYKYIVIEDNPVDMKILNDFLQKLPHLKLIDTFHNPIEAIQTIHSNTVDIIFMDIEMPEMTGLSLLNSLEKIPIVILISKHSQYAMEAFEMGVTDYIQKPFTFERLLRAVSRGIELLNLQNRSFQELTVPKDNFVFLKAGRELLKFNLNDILYVEALASFTKIFTEDKISVISESISDLHAKLPPNSFLRVHKSYLVPFSKIIGISTKNVILENHKIPLGLSYRERIEKVLAGDEHIND